MSTTDGQGTSQLVSFSPVSLGAISAIMVLTFSGGLAMPFNMDGISTHFQTGKTAAGVIAALELLSISLTSFVTARYASRLNVRRGVAMGISVALAANLATLAAPTQELLAAARIVAGCGAGPVVALIMSLAGRSTKPNITFAVTNSAMGVMGMGLSIAVPTALQIYGLHGAYGVYALCCAAALPLVLLVPAPTPVKASAGGGAIAVSPLPTSSWIALIGLAMVFLGHGVLVMLIFSIGRESGVSIDTLKLIFFIGSFFTALGPLLAGIFATRLSTTVPLAVLLTGLMMCSYVLANIQESLPYIICGPTFAGLPIVMLPIALSAFSLVDPSGRMAGTFPSFMTFAAAFAPFIGGYTADAGGYPAVGWVSISCILAGAALMAQIAFKADRLRRDPSLAPIPAAGE